MVLGNKGVFRDNQDWNTGFWDEINLDIFGYFWILLDTFGYFWILLDIFGYFLKSIVNSRGFGDKQKMCGSNEHEEMGVYERYWEIKAFSETIKIGTLDFGMKLIWIFLDTFGYFWILLDIFGYFLKSILI